MELVPTEPAGRVTRKARAYASEIQRLRDAGYTLAAIQRALRAAGITVSISTVQREAIRPPPASVACATNASTPHVEPTAAQTADTLLRLLGAEASGNPPAQPVSFAHDMRTGKQIAEDFMRGRITNPLLQEGN